MVTNALVSYQLTNTYRTTGLASLILFHASKSNCRKARRSTLRRAAPPTRIFACSTRRGTPMPRNHFRYDSYENRAGAHPQPSALTLRRPGVDRMPKASNNVRCIAENAYNDVNSYCCYCKQRGYGTSISSPLERSSASSERTCAPAVHNIPVFFAGLRWTVK
jgi:hypothetical protein